MSSEISSQENSKSYLEIKNSDTISFKDKEKAIDSLLSYNSYELTKVTLAYDLYDYGIFQYRNGGLDKAITVLNKCAKIIDGLSSFDAIKHKKTYNNLGFFYAKKLDYYNAYKSFKKLATIAGTDKYTANGYRLAGRYLRHQGDFYEAGVYYEKSIDVAKELGDLKMLLINSIDTGINYKEIATFKSVERGIQILEEAAKVLKKSNDNAAGKEDFISQELILSLFNNLGNLYNDREDYNFEKSKLNYDRSLEIALKLKDSASLSSLYNDLGYLYLHDVKEEAISYLNMALDYKPTQELKSIIYANQSLFFLKKNNTKEALQKIQLSIHELTPIAVNKTTSLPKKEEVSKNAFKVELIQNLIDKGKIWIEIYDSEDNKESLFNALETFELADYLVDIIRFESNERQSKLFWRKTASKIYTNAVKVCYYLNEPEKAFYFMEKNKSLLLLEDLSLRKQIEEANIPEAIHKKQLDLKFLISDLTISLQNSKKKDSIRSLLLESKEKYTNFIESLKGEYKFYYGSHKLPQIISINDVQKKSVKKDEIFIEYILGQEEGFGLLITKGNTQFFKIENYNALLEDAGKFRSLLEDPIKTQKDKENYISVAFSLYNSLFPKEISEYIIDKKLVIIPDSYLQNIPFEALLTSNKHDSYFIKKHEISYAYSLSFLVQNKSLERTNTNNFIGFAPIIFKGDMSSLLISKFEVEAASSLFSTTSYLYDDASTQNFIDNARNHNIIHIASHSDATEAQRPYIVFKDKKLSLDELYLTENTADLIVLSACKTSLGSLNEGEGVMSLARGFFNTGANSVLSSLWNVNDKSGAQIITDFYKEIKKGKSKSEALRTAKLNYLNSHRLSNQSPFYWASFVLIGDSENNFTYNESWSSITFFLIFTFLIIIALVFFKKIKK